MKHPKQKDMNLFIGKKCKFIKGQLIRNYLKKKIKSDELIIEEASHEETPVKWKPSQFTPKIGYEEGWIVGFGFCFDGSIIKQAFVCGGNAYFSPTKQIKYVRVRLSPTAKEIKVLASNITEVF